MFLKEIDWTGRILFFGACVLGAGALVMFIVSVSFAFHWINSCV